MKSSGTDAVIASLGVGFPVVKSDTTSLTLLIGPSVQWSGGGDECSTSEYCGDTYGGGAFITDFSWKPNKYFQFAAKNQFAVAFASEAKPSNSFTANIKFFPSINSGLFTSLQYQSIYESMSTPTITNTVTGQVGVEF